MAAHDIAVARAGPTQRRYELVEVWGDTVDIRHLRWAIALGIAISFGTFLGATYVLARFIADPAVARAYAMLVGLGGCLVAGAVCARLFKPKRIAAEAHADARRRADLIQALVADSSRGAIADVRTLPEHVLAEMRQVGLYELFAEQERRARAAAGEASDRPRAGAPLEQPKEVLR